MNTLIIIAMVVGYIVIGGIVAGMVMYAIDDYPMDEEVQFGVILGSLWPVTISIIVVALVIFVPIDFGRKIVKTFRKWRTKS